MALIKMKDIVRKSTILAKLFIFAIILKKAGNYDYKKIKRRY